MATVTDVKAPHLEKTDSDSDDQDIDVDGVNEKALLRKLDRKLLPPVTLLYLLSFLDRSNGTSSHPSPPPPSHPPFPPQY